MQGLRRAPGCIAARHKHEDDGKTPGDQESRLRFISGLPTVFMLTALTAQFAGAGEGVMFELDSVSETAAILQSGGWTLLTGINVMLFSLVHNPCSTTLYTIYKETGSARWTSFAAFMPLALGFALCFFVAQVWRLLSPTGY